MTEPGKNLRDAEVVAQANDERHEVEQVQSDRRRLLIAGLIATPFILTLAARPARATWDGGGTVGCYDYGDDDTDRSGDSGRDVGSDSQGGSTHISRGRRE